MISQKPGFRFLLDIWVLLYQSWDFHLLSFFFFRLSLDLMGNNATAMRRPFWKIAANSFKVVAIEPPPIRPFQPVTYCQEPSLETALTLTSLDYMWKFSLFLNSAYVALQYKDCCSCLIWSVFNKSVYCITVLIILLTVYYLISCCPDFRKWTWVE